MKQAIEKIFEVLAVVFDHIPLLNKIKGGRTIIGLVAMAVISALKAYGVGDPVMMDNIFIALVGFVGLSLNAKGRTE